MKIGLLSIGLMALVCIVSPVLADDTCGPAGCDAAKAAPAPPLPSVVQSNWKKAVLPQDASKPPAIVTKPIQPSAQPPAKTQTPPASSGRSIRGSASRNSARSPELGPEGLPGDHDPGASLQLRHQPGDLPRGYKGRDLFRGEGADGQPLREERFREVPRREEGRKGDVLHDAFRALFRLRRRRSIR